MMNRIYLMVTAAVILLAAAATAFPQAPAAQPAPPNVPVSKVAVIFSAAFQDAKQGIAKFTVLLTKLNGEFQATQNELNQTTQRIQTLQDEIKKLQESTAPIDPKTIQAKVDQLDQIKKDYQRRGEDARANYQKRRGDLFGPLQEDVGKALDAYAKARGITLVIDGSQVEGIVFAAESIDITKAFINDYNSKNPATASAATPR